MVVRITRDYGRPAIEITESGCSYADLPDGSAQVVDESRLNYHRSYLEALGRAIASGADVRSYHAWACSTILNGRKDTASGLVWRMWISKRSSGP